MTWVQWVYSRAEASVIQKQSIIIIWRDILYRKTLTLKPLAYSMSQAMKLETLFWTCSVFCWHHSPKIWTSICWTLGCFVLFVVFTQHHTCHSSEHFSVQAAPFECCTCVLWTVRKHFVLDPEKISISKGVGSCLCPVENQPLLSRSSSDLFWDTVHSFPIAGVQVTMASGHLLGYSIQFSHCRWRRRKPTPTARDVCPTAKDHTCGGSPSTSSAAWCMRWVPPLLPGSGDWPPPPPHTHTPSTQCSLFVMNRMSSLWWRLTLSFDRQFVMKTDSVLSSRELFVMKTEWVLKSSL